MKTIIEHGRLWHQEHFPKYTKCLNCGCTFAFEQEDVKGEEDAVFYPTHHYVKCPECCSSCRDDISKWRIFKEEQFDEI